MYGGMRDGGVQRIIMEYYYYYYYYYNRFTTLCPGLPG